MRITLYVILCLTSILAISDLLAVTPVYVDDDYNSSTAGWGVTRFATIATGFAAVDAAGTINVGAGTYYLTPSADVPSKGLLINKGVTIQSIEGRDNTFINAGGAYVAFWILANLGTVTINGFTFQNFVEGAIIQSWIQNIGTTSLIRNNRIESSNDYLRNGIQVSGNNSQVTGNIVLGESYHSETYGSSGILAVNGSNVLIENNTVTGSELGIQVMHMDYSDTGNYTVDHVTVNNNFISNTLQVGIHISAWEYNATINEPISNIFITNNQISSGVDAISLNACTVTGLSITGNEFQSNAVQFITDSIGPLNFDIDYCIAHNTFDRAVVIRDGSIIEQKVIYSLIQYAVDDDATGVGDVIEVAAGIYSENVTVDKSVAVIGAGKAITTVNADSGIAFSVTADYVSISGFKVTAASDTGILIKNANHTLVSGNDVTLCGIGIRLLSAVSNTITNNTVMQNGYGFSFAARDGIPCTNNTITGNAITDNTQFGAKVENASDDPLNATYYTETNYETVVNLNDNWWGFASGPGYIQTVDPDNDGLADPTGSGNPISDWISYNPWWTNSAGLKDPIVTITEFSNTITLSWETVIGATMYRVEAADYPYGTYIEVETTASLSTSYISNNMKFYRVIAVK